MLEDPRDIYHVCHDDKNMKKKNLFHGVGKMGIQIGTPAIEIKLRTLKMPSASYKGGVKKSDLPSSLKSDLTLPFFLVPKGKIKKII